MLDNVFAKTYSSDLFKNCSQCHELAQGLPQAAEPFSCVAGPCPQLPPWTQTGVHLQNTSQCECGCSIHIFILLRALPLPTPLFWELPHFHPLPHVHGPSGNSHFSQPSPLLCGTQRVNSASFKLPKMPPILLVIYLVSFEWMLYVVNLHFRGLNFVVTFRGSWTFKWQAVTCRAA